MLQEAGWQCDQCFPRVGSPFALRLVLMRPANKMDSNSVVHLGCAHRKKAESIEA